MSNVSLVDGHIDEPKMTDEEIKKALECCMNKELNGDVGNLTCLDCPLCNCSMGCFSIKSKNALDLIKRKDAEIDILIRKKETLRDEIAEQQAEIERLNKEVDRLSQCVMYHDGQIADAIKEFAERLKAEYLFWKLDDGSLRKIIPIYAIDYLVAEMTE